jgi:hypothetical protein
MARRRLLSLDPRALEMEDEEVNEAKYELISWLPGEVRWQW